METLDPVRVLIVDDSRSFLGAARDLLEFRGYVVAGEARSAAAAIAAAASLTPDAALIDIGLPDAPGDELAAYLRTHHPGMAVLLTSADPDHNAATLVDRSGAAGFVLKHMLAQVDLRAFWPFPAGRLDR